MTLAAAVMFWFLVAWVLAQAALVAAFIVFLLRWKRRHAPDQDCPKTAVILCLRGVDPFLPRTLEALFAQNYPRFDVHVIVDSTDDPAWPALMATIERAGVSNVYPTVLRKRLDTCSLKCSSIVQGVRDLDSSYDVVAFIDADVIPHRTWLRELVAPLDQDCYGGATGNRWFMPATPSLGSLARYILNAAAVVQMWSYRLPWGGTLALKADLLRNSNLLEKWSHAYCEDTMLFGELQRRGLRVAFVPSLMMVNRETCSLRECGLWLRRQFLAARLYHPRWFAVGGYAFATSFVPAVTVGLLAGASVQANWEAAGVFGGGLALYVAGMALMLSLVEACVRRIVRARGATTAWFDSRARCRFLPAVVLAQIVGPLAFAAALLTRRVRWRGVVYRIGGPWQIAMEAYRPYTQATADSGSTESL